MVSIAVTGVVHWFFLRPLLHLTGSSYVVDKLLHVVVPLAGRRRLGGRRSARPGRAARRSWERSCGRSSGGPSRSSAGRSTGWWPYPFIERRHARLGSRPGSTSLGVAVLFGLWSAARLRGWPTEHWRGGHHARPMSDNGPVTSPRTVAVLGSTGSIGTQALDVIARNPDRFRVVALSAGSNLDLVAEQAVTFDVDLVAVARGTPRAGRRGDRCVCRAGRPRGIPAPGGGRRRRRGRGAGCGADVVLNGITGAIGLRPTLAALAEGSTLALANKESLIVGGPLVKAAAAPRPDRAGRLRALRHRPEPARRARARRCGGWS